MILGKDMKVGIRDKTEKVNKARGALLEPTIIVYHELKSIRRIITQLYEPEVKAKRRKKTNSMDELDRRLDILFKEETGRDI